MKRKSASRTSRASAARRPAGESSRLWLRVDLGGDHKLGPGKIRMLELIDEHGSIRGAGAEMGMSYRRAWLLVDEINACFREPCVRKQHGGSAGGGALLTPFGKELAWRYREMERAATHALADHLRVLDRAVRRKGVRDSA